MGRTLQVSCVQMHWAKPMEHNLERTLHHIRLAAAEGSRVVLFPEMSLTGYYFPYAIQLGPRRWSRPWRPPAGPPPRPGSG